MNITQVNFNQSRIAFTSSLYQYDYGQKLQINGLELPQTFEVHFTLRTGYTTTTVLGTDNVVDIPDELLTEAGDLVCYIYLHAGADDGETEYKITIPVKARPEPSDYEPTPVEQDIITQTIAALNEAVDYVDVVAENLQEEIVDAVQTELDTGKYNGKGVPTGGTERQVLMKASDDDYDTEWVTNGAGVTDYADLENKPKINNVELIGNKSLSDLGIVIPNVPVQSVNGKIGAVVLTANDVGAVATESDPTVPSWAKQPSKPTYTASEVGALPSTTAIPSKTSDLTNDSGFISTETDPTVPSWAKQSSKPTYTASEVGALPDTYTAPVSSVNGQTGAVVIGNATTSTAGLMSATDKSHLDDLYDDYSSALVALGVTS